MRWAGTFASGGRQTVRNAHVCRYVTCSIKSAHSRGRIWTPSNSQLARNVQTDVALAIAFLGHGIPGSLSPKWHLDRFSRFCTAHPCAQNTQTHTLSSTCSNRPHLRTACRRYDLKMDRSKCCPSRCRPVTVNEVYLAFHARCLSPPAFSTPAFSATPSPCDYVFNTVTI